MLKDDLFLVSVAYQEDAKFLNLEFKLRHRFDDVVVKEMASAVAHDPGIQIQKNSSHICISVRTTDKYVTIEDLKSRILVAMLPSIQKFDDRNRQLQAEAKIHEQISKLESKLDQIIASLS